MSIFDLDHINTVWRLLVPPDKRLPKWLSWGTVLMTGQQWKQDTFFNGYMTGAANMETPATLFAYLTRYGKGDRIIFGIPKAVHIYGDNAVYEAVQDLPFSGIPPTGIALVPDEAPDSANSNSAAALAWLIPDPDSGNYWVKIQDNFIGANERALYSASRLVFEYALNKWFFTTFRQPSSDDTVHSDIYIKPNVRLNDLLYMGPAGNGYNYIPPLSPMATPYVGLSSLLANNFDFTIFFPVGNYNDLDAEPDVIATNNTTQRDNIVRSFADKINAAGMIYNITTY
jgi:hypothetical protein